jgi:hypothetical protein
MNLIKRVGIVVLMNRRDVIEILVLLLVIAAIVTSDIIKTNC